MQAIVQTPTTHILRFDNSEDVISELRTYCTQHAITAGVFTGLGAAEKITLSFYNLQTKEYQDTTLSEDVEITSLTGNVAVMENTCIIHAHGVFGKADYTAITGHVKALSVSATCEIHLQVLKTALKRAYDEKTGLNLLIT